MKAERRPILTFAAIPVVVIALSAALAACGDDNSSDSTAADTTPTTQSTAGVSGNTVSVQSIEGVGDVLLDSNGSALYTNDQDKGAQIACTEQCTSIWPVLTVDSGTQPASGDSTVESKLGVVTRPDGTDQVTFEGKPLYTFAEDSAGQVSGDGITDSFGGVSFTWTVATTSSSSQGSTGGGTAAGGTDMGSSSGGSSGGYGY